MRLKSTRMAGAGLVLGALLGLAATPLAAQPVTHRETESREFALAKADGRRTLIVDTVWGDIRVTGRPGAADTVRMTVTKRIAAGSPRWLDRARGEVELEVFAEPGTLELFVDGPWRDRDDRRQWAGRRVEVDYEAAYDFVLEVPSDTNLRLRTVVDGNVEVVAVTGEHDISNVTGDVELDRVGGSGRFHTVSGSVSGTFAGQPNGPSEWKTVSGDVEIRLPADLDADLLLASKWGEIWSEYALDPLPALPAKSSTRHGTFVIKTDQGARFRVGEGGAELRFETLSGDIRVRKQQGD